MASCSRSRNSSAHNGTRSTSGIRLTAVANAPLVSSRSSSCSARSGFSGRRPCSMDAICCSLMLKTSLRDLCVWPAASR
ncbi:hypothetical protein SFUMM280S_03796 [Streptomyces fumanus]